MDIVNVYCIEWWRVSTHQLIEEMEAERATQTKRGTQRKRKR